MVYDDSVSGLDAPGRPLWQVLAYPLSWTIAVLVAVFALGLGTAAGAEEQAISVVQSYVKAREQGNGALACSMLSREQQRELVAIQTRDYPHASAARCAGLILSTDPASHLLNPGLGAFAAGPLEARYNRAGFALVGVAGEANTVLVVVFEHGQPKLDIRGAEKLGFERGCAGAAGASSAQCDCVFSSLRAEGLVDAAFRGEFAARVRADGRRPACLRRRRRARRGTGSLACVPVQEPAADPQSAEDPPASPEQRSDEQRPAHRRQSPGGIDGITRFMGLRWEDPQTVWLTIRPELINAGGLLSGVATYALVDYCMGSTLWAQTTREERIATISIAVNYVQTATEGEIVCRTTLDRRNKRTAVMRSEVTHEDGRLLVTAIGSYTIFPPRAGEARPAAPAS